MAGVTPSSGNLLRTTFLVCTACACGMTGLHGQTQGATACPDEPPSTTATLGDLLQGKLSGVTVLQSGGGASGGAKRIRIRGVNSVRGNDPIIVVDNVRMTPLSQTGPRGAHSIPLFEFVDPAEITSVEILRGPAATIQYADASGGVIRIYTRRGSGEAAAGADESSRCSSTIKKPGNR